MKKALRPNSLMIINVNGMNIKSDSHPLSMNSIMNY